MVRARLTPGPPACATYSRSAASALGLATSQRRSSGSCSAMNQSTSGAVAGSHASSGESLSGGGEEPSALTAVMPSPVHAVAEHASVCRECSCVWLVWLDCAEAVAWPSPRGDARTASPRDSAVAAMSSPVMAFACGSPFVVLMCRGGEPCRWLSRTGGRCGPATACNQKKCFIDVNSSTAGWVFGQKWLSSSVCMHCARLT